MILNRKTILRNLIRTAWTLAVLYPLVLAGWEYLPDESLNAEAQRVLDLEPRLPDAENMYLAIRGFPASPDLDAHRVGEQIGVGFAEWRKTKRGLQESFDMSPYLGTLAFSKPSYTAPCKPESKACLVELRANQPALEEWLDRFAPYVVRYRALRAYGEFVEPVDALLETPFPRWGDVMFVSDLVNAQIAFDMARPERQGAALQDLAADIAFWERLGERADTLITKMISAAALESKYRLASELLTEYPEAVSAQRDAVAAITKPLPPQWTNMKRVMDGEFRFSAGMLRDLKRYLPLLTDDDKPGAWLAHPIMVELNAYRVNASINMLHERYTLIGTFLSQPAGSIVEKRAEYEQESTRVALWSPVTFVYNPVGKVLTSRIVASWSDYAIRLNDVAGYSRLLEVQRQLIHSRGQPVEASKTILATPALADPYNELPMSWNAATGELRFAARGKKLGGLRGATAQIPARDK